MSQTHILIVDDEPSILRFVGAGLRAEGFEITEAADGSRQSRLWRSLHPTW